MPLGRTMALSDDLNVGLIVAKRPSLGAWHTKRYRIKKKKEKKMEEKVGQPIQRNKHKVNLFNACNFRVIRGVDTTIAQDPIK